MSELKKAYETLGLPEHAEREEVEKRYELLMRRARSRENETVDEDGTPAFEEVNRAYRFILQYEKVQAIQEAHQQKYGKYGRYARHAEKVDHFFSYYRWHLFGGIALVVFLIYGIIAYSDHRAEQARLAALPPVNLEMYFLGRFVLPQEAQNTEPLEAAILEQFPEWQRVEAQVQYLNMATQSSMDFAVMQKVIAQLATERPDVYMLDADTYQWIAQNGGLMDLEPAVEGRLQELLPEGAAVSAIVLDRDQLPDSKDPNAPAKGEEYILGIDVGDSSLAQSLPLGLKEMIVGIRINAERPENAFLLIERYLEALD